MYLARTLDFYHVTKMYFVLHLVFISKYVEAVRIFSYQPVPFDSHQAVFRALTDAFARDGHELVVLTTLPRKQPLKNVMEIDVHEISYSGWEKGYEAAAKLRSTFGFLDHLQFTKFIHDYMGPVHELQLNHPYIQALIQNKTQIFDLILLEANEPAGIVLSAIFEAPVLLVSSMTVTADIFSLIGAETNNYFYPDFSTTSVRDLSLWKKICSLYNIALKKLAKHNHENFGDVYLKRHLGSQAPTTKELENNVAMLFMNAYRYWDNNRPTPTGSMLYMGGLHFKTPNNLSEDLKTFLENSKHGVVIMSLGSKLKSSSLPSHTLCIIKQVFSELPYDFIWNWDTDELPNKPSNVRIMNKIPQFDLLHHPKVKALITQGGLLSTHEAIAAKVPLVGLPVFPDQYSNTGQYEKLGIGIRLDIDNLTKEDIRQAIVAVVEEEKYRENIGRLSRIASDSREDALQTASRWVFRLATTRSSRCLRAPLADATFSEFFLLDVILVATVSVIVITIAIAFVIKRLIPIIKNRICFRNA